MIIRWLDDAIHDLQSLRNYISEDNSIAARKVVKKILDSIDILIEHPAAGKPGRILNTRELIVAGTPYLVPYTVKDNTIEILRIFHCSMKWPEEN